MSKSQLTVFTRPDELVQELKRYGFDFETSAYEIGGQGDGGLFVTSILWRPPPGELGALLQKAATLAVKQSPDRIGVLLKEAIKVLQTDKG
jgi:hypothetical protein